jgi:hypothetical protein
MGTGSQRRLEGPGKQEFLKHQARFQNQPNFETGPSELVPKSVILSPALAVSQAKALRNRIFQGCSSKI